MHGFRWVSCCAMAGMWFVALSLRTMAQENGEGATGEKSVLVADTTSNEAAEAWDFCRCVGDSDSPSVARIDAALRSPLRSSGLEFVDTPLEQVAALLQDEYDIPIQLDIHALDEVGLGPDEPVTIRLHAISLRSATRLMLKRLGLTHVIQDEVLMITTPEAAEAELTICVYDVRGLTNDATDKTNKALIDMILSCVATETWAAHRGGEAQIRSLKPGLLVISQTQNVHEEIRGLLAAIRAVRRRPDPVEAVIGSAPREPELADDNPSGY